MCSYIGQETFHDEAMIIQDAPSAFFADAFQLSVEKSHVHNGNALLGFLLVEYEEDDSKISGHSRALVQSGHNI